MAKKTKIAIDWQLVSKRIDEKMSRHNLSCEDIEELVGAPHSSVHRLRTGQAKSPSFELLVQVSAALSIPLTSLFDGAIQYSSELGDLSVRKSERKKLLSAEHLTGLSPTELTLLNHATTVHGRPYISEALDDFGFMCDLERRLYGIALVATRLRKAGSSANWKDNLLISGGLRKIETSFRERIENIVELYATGKGYHSAVLMERSTDNGNNPQENK